MRTKKWLRTPEAATKFDFSGDALATRWTRLHEGDCEPPPTSAGVAQRFGTQTTVDSVLEAWRAFHTGAFQRAFELSNEVDGPAVLAGLKALCVYASYVETNDDRAQAMLLEAAERAEALIAEHPREANGHYLHAFALGRYSQRISIVAALGQGLAGKIERSLQQTLKLQPKHADAHLALALYHAEIVGKLGSLAAGLTYGASTSTALEHFKKGLKLAPHSPAAPLEYAHGLRLIDARRHDAEIDRLIARACESEPVDAMEWLDRERARRPL